MKIPEREKPQKKVINKGFLRDLEGYEQSDKNLFHLPRQGIEHMFLLRLVGQNAANRGNRKYFYYRFTTTDESDHNMLYKHILLHTRHGITRKC